MHPSSPILLTAMCEGWRGRSGDGGPNQTKNQKPKIKTEKAKHQNQNQTKPHETRPAQCNKRKLSSRKQCNDNNTLYPKTLTAEPKFFQMSHFFANLLD
jgi:hypothetical protein